MKKLFDPLENNLIKERVNKLTPDSKALWGRMNVAQALAHLQTPMLVAFGELQLEGGVMAFLFGKMAKKQMLEDKPFKKNMPTVKEFKFTGKNLPGKDFEKEKTILLSYIDRFITKGPGAIVNKKHPFFGPMTEEEWDKLQWKHLDHHLRQFGV